MGSTKIASIKKDKKSSVKKAKGSNAPVKAVAKKQIQKASKGEPKKTKKAAKKPEPVVEDDSSSSDEEEVAPKKKQQKVTKKEKKAAPVESSSDDSSSDEEQPKAKATKKNVKAQKAKPVESSSDDSSSSESESDEEEPAKPEPVAAQKEESSSDDSSDEAEVAAAPAKKDESDDSSDDSSSDDEAKPEAKAESSDDDSSSDSDDEKDDSSESSSDDEDEEMEAAEEKPASKKRSNDDANDSTPAKMTKLNEDAESKSVFVGGLAYAATEEDIREVFGECGTIVNVRLPVYEDTGKSRGIAFIDFEEADAVEKACAKDGAEIKGRWVKVSASNKKQGDKKDQRKKGEKPEGCTTVFLGNLPFDADEYSISKVFEDCGEIVSVRLCTDRETGQPRGFGYLEFTSTEAVDAAVQKSGTPINGREVRVDFAAPRGESNGNSGGFGGPPRGGRGGARGGRGRGGSRGRGGAPRGRGAGFGSFSGQKTKF